MSNCHPAKQYIEHTIESTKHENCWNGKIHLHLQQKWKIKSLKLKSIIHICFNKSKKEKTKNDE